MGLKISSSDSDSEDSQFTSFHLSFGALPSLSPSVRDSCLLPEYSRVVALPFAHDAGGSEEPKLWAARIGN